jgi:hypothetical protein
MKNKDFAGLAKQLLEDLPGFFVKGPMAASRPVKHALRGLYFEGSSFDAKSFYVWTFFLPLFVPAKHVSFNFGKRLRSPSGGDRWNADAPNLVAELKAAVKREALPFLSGIESAEDIAMVAATFLKAGDPYGQQAIAYAWARAGEGSRAVEELERLVCLLDAKVPWHREMAERAEALKTKLLTNPAEAQRQLETWESETSQNLGLERFRR